MSSKYILDISQVYFRYITGLSKAYNIIRKSKTYQGHISGISQGIYQVYHEDILSLSQVFFRHISAIKQHNISGNHPK